MKTYAAAGAAIALLAAPASAEVLLRYDNDVMMYDSATPLAAAFTHPLLTARALTNSGVSPSLHMESYQTNGWPANGLDPTAFVRFSTTPTAGQVVHFESMDVDIWLNSSVEKTTSFALRSSLDTFGSSVFVGATPATALGTGGTQKYHIPLAGLAPQSAETEFRLYFYDVPSPGQNWSIIAMGGMGDGIALNGSITAIPAVPEPEEWLLMLAGLGLTVAAARRFRGDAWRSPGCASI